MKVTYSTSLDRAGEYKVLTADFSEEVRRGAALMDRLVPGWEDEIKMEFLDLGSSNSCVLGQLAISTHLIAPLKKDICDAHVLTQDEDNSNPNFNEFDLVLHEPSDKALRQTLREIWRELGAYDSAHYGFDVSEYALVQYLIKSGDCATVEGRRACFSMAHLKPLTSLGVDLMRVYIDDETINRWLFEQLTYSWIDEINKRRARRELALLDDVIAEKVTL